MRQFVSEMSSSLNMNQKIWVVKVRWSSAGIAVWRIALALCFFAGVLFQARAEDTNAPAEENKVKTPQPDEQLRKAIEVLKNRESKV